MHHDPTFTHHAAMTMDEWSIINASQDGGDAALLDRITSAVHAHTDHSPRNLDLDVEMNTRGVLSLAPATPERRAGLVVATMDPGPVPLLSQGVQVATRRVVGPQYVVLLMLAQGVAAQVGNSGSGVPAAASAAAAVAPAVGAAAATPKSTAKGECGTSGRPLAACPPRPPAGWPISHQF